MFLLSFTKLWEGNYLHLPASVLIFKAPGCTRSLSQKTHRKSWELGGRERERRQQSFRPMSLFSLSLVCLHPSSLDTSELRVQNCLLRVITPVRRISRGRRGLGQRWRFDPSPSPAQILNPHGNAQRHPVSDGLCLSSVPNDWREAGGGEVTLFGGKNWSSLISSSILQTLGLRTTKEIMLYSALKSFPLIMWFL